MEEKLSRQTNLGSKASSGGGDPENSISRRTMLKRSLVWSSPVILSFMIPSRVSAKEKSVVCTAAGDPKICSRCEIRACDTEGCLGPCDKESPGCPNNCDWCDGGLLDICNPNF